MNTKEMSSSNSNGVKNRFTKMLLRSACTIDTANPSTSLITISKNGTSGGTNNVNEEPPGTPSLFDLLNKHRYERKSTGTDSRPKLDKNLSVRTAPVVQISIDCTGRRSLTSTNKLVPILVPVKTKEEKEKKKNKYSSNGYNSRKCSSVSSSAPSPKVYYSNHETRRNRNTIKPGRKGTRKLHSDPYGFSTSSSAHSDMETGLFSSEGGGEEETHTLFSSKSFSSDSSEFYHRTNKPKKLLNSKQSPLKPVKKPVPISTDKTKPLKPVKEHVPISKDETKTLKPVKKPASISTDNTKEETEINKKPVQSVSTKENKPTAIRTSTGTGTGTGTAVVKKSSDPYMDFRSSMVEMILEENVVCVKEMERLLKSYLALNAARHHPIIVRAFEDICEAIFSK